MAEKKQKKQKKASAKASAKKSGARKLAVRDLAAQDEQRAAVKGGGLVAPRRDAQTIYYR